MPVNSFVEYPMSWKPDKTELGRPIYLSIAERLEKDIESGLLAPGTKLPPQRELADFLDINFTTVTRAYQICERKGLIYAVTGNGTFVSPNAGRSVTISLDNKPNNLIELGFIASFDQCNRMIVDTVREVARKKRVEQLFGYDDPTGFHHHKMAGLNWMQSFGIQASPENIAIVSGSQNGLAVALLALFEPGDRIAVDTYTYANFIELARLYHIQLVAIQGDDEGMLPDELDGQCIANEVHGVFLMPSCANPTTTMISDQRKHELAQVIHKHDLILLEDDMLAFLTVGIIADYKQPMYQLIPEQTVYVCGTSKPICSGLRVAYLVFGEGFREKILRAIFNINVKTSSLDAEIVSELILTGKANLIADEKKRLAEQANALFSECFPCASKTGHPLSFYRWLQINDTQKSEILEAAMQSWGIRVFHSDRFLISSLTDKSYLRIALASTRSLEELRGGLKILSKGLQLINAP